MRSINHQSNVIGDMAVIRQMLSIIGYWNW